MLSDEAMSVDYISANEIAKKLPSKPKKYRIVAATLGFACIANILQSIFVMIFLVWFGIQQLVLSSRGIDTGKFVPQEISNSHYDFAQDTNSTTIVDLSYMGFTTLIHVSISGFVLKLIYLVARIIVMFGGFLSAIILNIGISIFFAGFMFFVVTIDFALCAFAILANVGIGPMKAAASVLAIESPSEPFHFLVMDGIVMALSIYVIIFAAKFTVEYKKYTKEQKNSFGMKNATKLIQ